MITRNSQKSQNSFSGEFRVITFHLHVYVKMITWNFIMTHGLVLGSENSKFQVIVLFLIPKNDNLELFCISQNF